MAFTAQNSEG